MMASSIRRVALHLRMTYANEVHSTDELFDNAIAIIQNLPKQGPLKISIDQKLQFYSLFKQATIGPCNVARPSFWNLIEVWKWNAWNGLGSMPADEAKEKYVNTFREFVAASMHSYQCIPWLKANDQFCETVLRPKFYVLGYDWELVDGEDGERLINMNDIEEDEQQQSSKRSTVNKKRKVASSNKEKISGAKSDSDTTLVTYSDDDYMDAKEEHEPFHLLPAHDAEGKDISRSETCSSSSSSNNSPLGATTHITTKKQQQDGRSADGINPSNCCTVITRLNGLLRMLSSQQEILTSMMGYFASPQGDRIVLRWPALIFLVVWPILVNILIKYIRYLFRFLKF